MSGSYSAQPGHLYGIGLGPGDAICAAGARLGRRSGPAPARGRGLARVPIDDVTPTRRPYPQMGDTH